MYYFNVAMGVVDLALALLEALRTGVVFVVLRVICVFTFSHIVIGFEAGEPQPPDRLKRLASAARTRLAIQLKPWNELGAFWNQIASALIKGFVRFGGNSGVGFLKNYREQGPGVGLLPPCDSGWVPRETSGYDSPSASVRLVAC